MAVSGVPLLLVVLALFGGQLSAGKRLSTRECGADGGECVAAGRCMSPNAAAEACDSGASVCCNPTGLQAFKQTLELDGFEIDLRINPCSDKKCVDWYGGSWVSDPATCVYKNRLVNYCATTDKWCCAPPCNEKKRCIRRKGYCVPRRTFCPSNRSRHRMCRGKMCFCCLPPFPVPSCNCSESKVSICDASTIDLAEGSCVQIYSPFYNMAYRSNTDCSIQVTVPDSCKIQIEFCEVSLERCFFDTLTITDGVNTNVFCGTMNPPDLTTATNTATLQFVTDVSQVNRGFCVSVTAVNCFNCANGPVYEVGTDTTVTTSTGGLIYSPAFPSDYPNFVNYSMVITAPAGSVIKFDYTTFVLEDGPPACSFDYFQIYDVSIPSSTKYCGSVAPSFTMSATNEVEIIFSTDKAFVFAGFNICFTVVQP